METRGWSDLLVQYGLKSAFAATREYFAEDGFDKESNQTELESSSNIEHQKRFLLDGIQLLQFLHPEKEQLIFLLELSCSVAQDESTFIKLHDENLSANLIKISSTAKLDVEESVKYYCIKLFNNLLKHTSGTKWMLEMNYWTDVYAIACLYHNSHKTRLLEVSYKFLASILEEYFKGNSSSAMKILGLFTDPIAFTKIEASGCLVGVLECLLDRHSFQILEVCIKINLRETASRMASSTNDPRLRVIMYKIMIILSLYQTSGVGVIKENLFTLIGLYKIINIEIEKQSLQTILEIVHDTLGYIKYPSLQLPKYVNRTEMDPEVECFLFLNLPAGMIPEYLWHMVFWKSHDMNDYRELLRWKIIKGLTGQCSPEGIGILYKIKDMVLRVPLEDLIFCMDLIIKSKDRTSSSNINRIIIALSLNSEEIFGFLKAQNRRILTYEEQLLIEKNIDVLTELTRMPHLKLHKAVVTIDIPKCVTNCLHYFDCSSQIVIKGVRFLKLLLSKFLSPNMHLLIDSTNGSAFENIGCMLYGKLLSSEWEIRQASLDLLCEISRIANESFPSFKKVIRDAKLPEMVLRICLADQTPLVRAEGFKALQQVIKIDKSLNCDDNIMKILLAIQSESEPTSKTEAIKFITSVYKYTSSHVQGKILECINQQTFHHHLYPVKLEILHFWKCLERELMTTAGWTESGFPEVTFFKKIITMTKEEIGRRIYHVLSQLSQSGCLDCIKHFCSLGACEEISKSLYEWLGELDKIYTRYEITEELLRSYEPVGAATNDGFQDILQECFPKDCYMEVTLETRLRPSGFIRLLKEHLYNSPVI